MRLIVVAFLIGAPVALLFAIYWLKGFAYRVAISGWVFGVAFTAAILITAMVISIQAIRAAMINPVRSLRSE